MRFSKNDWIELGMKQLENTGPAGLTVDALCTAASRTRGSFYHHFEGHEDFVRAMMAFWKKRDTDDVIEIVEATSKSKSRELNSIASALNHRLEGRIRQFSLRDSSAADILSSVDETRISYLSKLHQEHRKVPESEALTLAKLEYAAYVGAQILWPNDKAKSFETLGGAFISLVNAALNQKEYQI